MNKELNGIAIGKYQLLPVELMDETRISISNDEGEWGEFNIADLEKVIEEFFKKQL